jgi:molybdopterin molybdotransferase
MLTVAEARSRILATLQPVPGEVLPLPDCWKRVLSVDIAATSDLPLFDNSSMDGFAIRSVDTRAASAPGLMLRVVADIKAGQQSALFLQQGEAARIMTGAPLPAGADAVIPIEDTDVQDRKTDPVLPEFISIHRIVAAGEYVRARGLDVRQGQLVLQKGTRLKPQDIGLLAMLGIAQVQVHANPRIALLSSGDELLAVDAPLESGKIRDSNSYTLAALVEDSGGEILRLGVAKDSQRSVEDLLEKAVHQNADLILASAGVSVGAFDYVREVLESKGELDFWRVNMRPGKPIVVGKYRQIPFIGLPGNPVSAFVGFEVFVREAIGRLAGLTDSQRPRVRVRLGEAVQSDGRESYLRAILQEQDGNVFAKLTGHQGSGNLLSLVQANALLIIPAGVKCVPAGQEVEAWRL